MPRSHFINPYTFVPLRPEGPVCTADEPATHAWLQAGRFTGTIECELQFLSPAVISGAQRPGDRETGPGYISAFRHGGHVAIPGSRLRGHILQVMKMLNASPVRHYQNRPILSRVSGKPSVKKGFICQTPQGGLEVREIDKEILVAHPQRTRRDYLFNTHEQVQAFHGRGNAYDLKVPVLEATRILGQFSKGLQDLKGRYFFESGYYSIRTDGLEPAEMVAALKQVGMPLSSQRTSPDGWRELAASPVCFERGADQQIPPFDPAKPLHMQGVNGEVYSANPLGGPGRNFRHYMVQEHTTGVRRWKGRWVAFPCWSGQDGENRFKDLNGITSHNHWNSHHVVNLEQANLIAGGRYPLSPDLLKQFDEMVAELARLTRDRKDPLERKYEQYVSRMRGLKAGDFVYFQEQGGAISSIGRHYRYLVPLGTIEEEVDKANNENSWFSCMVSKMAGWTDDKDTGSSMKGRIWCDMAMGPEEGALEERNLRIFSSQPPKSAHFYLSGGGYGEITSQIRGRKLYWHDPYWRDPLWDNEDLRGGEHAFEQPDPENKNLWAQWSRAEVLMPAENAEDRTRNFTFSVRVMNLSTDEMNLLLTALVGFAPSVPGGTAQALVQGDREAWCHKIGYGRPFIGSASIKVTAIKKLDCKQQDWAPQITDEDLQTRGGDLKKWQLDKLSLLSPHVKALRRIMHYKGAYQVDGRSDPAASGARITYPLGQTSPHLNFRCKEEDRPKSYTWFANNRTILLPRAEQLESSQALPVWLGKAAHGRQR